MGYTTEFSGSVSISPPLNQAEIDFLNKFSESRRLNTCQWVPTDDGTELVWDGNEKFYESEEWMKYIIQHFLKPNCVAKNTLPFLQANHVVNGVIHACGEEKGDVWDLNVTNNVVSVDEYELVKKKK